VAKDVGSMLGPTYYAAVRSDLRNLNPDL